MMKTTNPLKKVETHTQNGNTEKPTITPEIHPQVRSFFDPNTWTVSYVVYEKPGSACAIIDPVLDFDPKSGRIQTTSADRIASFVREQSLNVVWLLETHAHADHLSAAHYLRQQLGGKIGIGAAITKVQTVFRELFNLEREFVANGSQFDHRFEPEENFMIGQLAAKALATPGHTPACMAYQISDAVFVGDTLFMPDVGTARCDFPGGNAQQLYRSIQRLLRLPPTTRLFMCHDYPPNDRQPAWECTVADQRAQNIHVRDGITEEAFVAMRQQRDANLEMPVLMLPSVQVNIRAGSLPPAESNGRVYLKIPVTDNLTP